jgi:DUF4097 and DUF4098 domain-containing protein YvlB
MPRFDTPGRVAFRISTPGGRVTVDTWDEPGVEVDVTALRGDEGSRLAADETRIEAKERGSLHEIVVEVPKREGRFGIFGRSPEIGIAIRCPEGADVDLTTHSSDFEGRGPLGDVNVKSASGDVSLGDVKQLGFGTASGDLTAGAVAGTLTLKSASGDVHVRSVGGPATVNTVSGDVRIGRTDESANLNAVSGDIDLESAGAAVRISAVSGDVSVAARAGLALWIDAQSVSGTMQSDLDVSDLPPAEGDASPVELRIRTVSGDVRISRSGAPVP